MRKFLRSALLPILSAGCLTILLVPLSGRADLPAIQHDLQAIIDPNSGHLSVIDRLTLPPGQDTVDFLLHTGMAPRVRPGEGALESLSRDGDLETLRLRLSPDATSAAITYEGTIRHPLASVSEGMGRERQVSAGTIGPDGVFLDGNSGWYPRVPGTLQRFTLKVSLPAGWQAVSQGAGPDGDPQLKGVVGSTWTESQPQDDIYLIAAPFTLYRDLDHDHAAGVESQVWLREPRRAAGRRLSRRHPRVSGPLQPPDRPLSLCQVRPGRELLGDRLWHALLHPARPPGHPPALHHHQFLPA